MPPPNSRLRAYLVANPSKTDWQAAFDDMTRWIEDRGQLAGAATAPDGSAIAAAHPSRVIVLGGDGTILTVGREIVEHDLPIAGVNLGKLGYMASFAIDEMQQYFDRIMSDATLVSGRMTMSVTIAPPESPKTESVAINDCVLHVGPPYRMLTMEVSLDGQALTSITGDGLIVATPTGSTAHNMSSGGPILEPEVEALILTPICPHSLAHRPVVLAPSNVLKITIVRGFEGSAAVIDGQASNPCPTGTVITITRGAHPFRLIRHPDRTSWQALVKKLKWGQGPG